MTGLVRGLGFGLGSLPSPEKGYLKGHGQCLCLEPERPGGLSSATCWPKDFVLDLTSLALVSFLSPQLLFFLSFPFHFFLPSFIHLFTYLFFYFGFPRHSFSV